ncbi:MAG: hypothetical protein HUJ61_03040 [Bacilli bacterium]|nr:hypothetical protein [Bacilli bacterium]
MTFNEANEFLKSKGLYVLKENAYGTYEEYIAKLNDLWADANVMTDENYKTFDELLEDEWYKEIVEDNFKNNIEPSETIEKIIDSINNDENIENDADFDDFKLDDNEEIEYSENSDDEALDELDFENSNDYADLSDDEDLSDVEDEIRYLNNEDDEEDYSNPDEYFNDNVDDINFVEAVEFLHNNGYEILNENQKLLNEAWYDNTGLNNTDQRAFKNLINRYNSMVVKRRGNRTDMPKGSYMTPSMRARLYNEFKIFKEKLADISMNLANKVQTVYMDKLTDAGWRTEIRRRNLDWATHDLEPYVGHAEIEPIDDFTDEERAEVAEEINNLEDINRTEDDEDEIAERSAEQALRATREREENPEPEDLIDNSDIDIDEGNDNITTNRVRRRRMRTGNREYVDQNSINTAIIKINIDTTNDPETLAEAEEVVDTIRETLNTRYGDNEVYGQLCNIEAAEVDIEDEETGARKEYHVVIKMPAEIKDEIASVVKNEMEDVFTFVNSEHPEDSVYEFETSGTRTEVYDEEYDYDEPTVTRRNTRPQTNITRRVAGPKRWRVAYKVADEDGNDTGRVKWVINVEAPTAEAAMNAVENPEDIESAYAGDVFKAIEAVEM